jgi:hypothetical protein
VGVELRAQRGGLLRRCRNGARRRHRISPSARCGRDPGCAAGSRQSPAG